MIRRPLHQDDALISSLLLMGKYCGELSGAMCDVVAFMDGLHIDVFIAIDDERYCLASIMQLTCLTYILKSRIGNSRIFLETEKECPEKIELMGTFFDQMYRGLKQHEENRHRYASAVKQYVQATGEFPIVVILLGTAISERISRIESEISFQNVRYHCYDDHEIRLSDFPKYAKADIIIFNWSKYGFLLRLFLNKEPCFNCQMVLYTGIYSSIGHTASDIKSWGIFNYVISADAKHGLDDGDTWEDVINAVTAQNSNHAGELTPLKFLLYRWSHVKFGASHFQIFVDELSHVRFPEQGMWGEVPQVYDRAPCAFESLWMYEIREEGRTMDVKPLWGSPKYTGKKSVCFVLMPFQEPFNTIYNDHIKLVLEANHINVERANDYYTTNSVMKDIWNGINNADIIIAELTGRNPNVLYELGIAHTLGKEVIMISQEEEDIPFDLRYLRYYLYKYTPRGC